MKSPAAKIVGPTAAIVIATGVATVIGFSISPTSSQSPTKEMPIVFDMSDTPLPSSVPSVVTPTSSAPANLYSPVPARTTTGGSIGGGFVGGRPSPTGDGQVYFCSHNSTRCKSATPTPSASQS